MVEVAREKYPLNPTLKLVNDEGRATAEFFRILKAIGQIIGNITIEDGEVTTDMIAAGAITAGKITVTSLDEISTFLGDVAIDGDLIVGGTITTGAVASNAITEVTTATQVGTGRTTDPYLIQANVPVTTTGNTGVLVSFTAFMQRPVISGANFGDWRLELHRNGVIINQTPNLYYDDNFAYPVICAFVDETPGTNPLYEIVPIGLSGPCDFDILGGLGVFSLLKR